MTCVVTSIILWRHFVDS